MHGAYQTTLDALLQGPAMEWEGQWNGYRCCDPVLNGNRKAQFRSCEPKLSWGSKRRIRHVGGGIDFCGFSADLIRQDPRCAMRQRPAEVAVPNVVKEVCEA